MESKILKRELSREIKFSERDVVLYLEKRLKGSLCGDCFDGTPWGAEENKQVYLLVFGIDDKLHGIKNLS